MISFERRISEHSYNLWAYFIKAKIFDTDLPWDLNTTGVTLGRFRSHQQIIGNHLLISFSSCLRSLFFFLNFTPGCFRSHQFLGENQSFFLFYPMILVAVFFHYENFLLDSWDNIYLPLLFRSIISSHTTLILTSKRHFKNPLWLWKKCILLQH